MELGAPMIAMYLLGHPDHYTSHRFRPFFWRTYYNQIHRFWTGLEAEEKVMVVRKKGHIVGISESQNYVFRAAELGHLKLYDFMLLCERVKIPKDGKGSSAGNVDAETDLDRNPLPPHAVESQANEEDEDAYEKDSWLASSDDEGDDDVEHVQADNCSASEESDNEVVRAVDGQDNGPEEDVEMEGPDTGANAGDNDDLDIEMDEPVDEIPKVFGYPPSEPLKKGLHAFLYGHSLASDYCMKIREEVDPYLVLNFMRLLPRSDSENRDEYIRVMLMLFKPWRHARDLKRDDQTWEDAFASHSFTERELELMKNFNLRWECIDGRDSFRDSLKKGTFADRDDVPIYGESIDEITREVDVSEVVETAFPTEDSHDDDAIVNKHYANSSDMYHSIQALMMRQQWGVPRAVAELVIQIEE
ncbi:hypothetical protein EV714DRAFT_287681 [Schizophyllum commune]